MKSLGDALRISPRLDQFICVKFASNVRQLRFYAPPLPQIGSFLFYGPHPPYFILHAPQSPRLDHFSSRYSPTPVFPHQESQSHLAKTQLEPPSGRPTSLPSVPWNLHLVSPTITYLLLMALSLSFSPPRITTKNMNIFLKDSITTWEILGVSLSKEKGERNVAGVSSSSLTPPQDLCSLIPVHVTFHGGVGLDHSVWRGSRV